MRTIRFADVLDILLVAAFLYIVIDWLRKSRPGSPARRALVIAVPLIIVLILADRFELFLVESLVRLLLFVLLFGLVLMFQSDLRRLLDRIGSFDFAKRTSQSIGPRPVTILTAVAKKLAVDRTGALIALKGAEPWSQHVQGGITLNGLVSRPLLFSIFAPDTPGHDGAVLMEGDRVTRFGVHLPLSRRTPPGGRAGGTRHSAALGLSEECDAFVIVVSEETGSVSVAQNGQLTTLDSPDELETRLRDFWDAYYSNATPSLHRGWKRRIATNAGIALALATTAWLLFGYSTTIVRRAFDVPIAFRNVPPEWVIEGDSALEARVVLSGSEQAFRTMNPSDLMISFDLPDPEPGPNELAIGVNNVALPAGLMLSYVDPPSVTVTAKRHFPAEVPIVIQRAAGVVDTTLVAQPRTVMVLVPEGTNPPDRIVTEPFRPRTPVPAGGQRARLSLPSGVRLAPGQSAEVAVRRLVRS